MSLSTEMSGGSQDGIFSNVAFQAAFGVAFGGMEEDLGYYSKFKSTSLGWNNKYIQAAKGGALEGFGYVGKTPQEIAQGQKWGVRGGQYSFLGSDQFKANFLQVESQVNSMLGPANYTAKGTIGKNIQRMSHVRLGSNIIRGEGVAIPGLMPKGMMMRGAGAALGAGFSAHAIYSGYKSGGISGAVRAGAQEAVGWAAYKMASVAFGGVSMTAMAGGAVALAGAYGTYKALEYGRENYKSMKNTEFATPLQDPSGMGATIRQRSIAAIQGSQINGRVALGNEAALLHNMFF